jgi:hypothetical protein
VLSLVTMPYVGYRFEHGGGTVTVESGANSRRRGGLRTGTANLAWAIARQFSLHRVVAFLFALLAVEVSAFWVINGRTESPICADAHDKLVFVSPAPSDAPYANWHSISVEGIRPRVNLDAAGLPVWSDGTFHPTAATVLGLHAVAGGDRETAEHMAAGLLEHRDGGWFPLNFPFDYWHQAAGWRSQITQGLALSVFTRLGDLESAAQIAPTIVPNDRGWLEEYPGQSPILNGHIFAALGLWDYWTATGDRDAGARALAAIDVVRRNLGTFFTSGRVWYDLEHRQRMPAAYRSVYVEQFTWLKAITGEQCFQDAIDATLAYRPS